MKTRSIILAAVLFLAAFLRPSHAEDLVDFTLNDCVTKQQINTTAFRGKCLLIIFGSIYCKPCVEMLPVVRRLRDTYMSEGLVVIGIDIDFTSEELKIHQFIKDQEIQHIYLIDTIKVARQNRVFTLPTTLIVNGKGGIEKRFFGLRSYEEIEKSIKKILFELKNQ